MRQSRCALSQPATAPCKVLSETTARPAFLSCGHREGGREGEERNESRKNVNRKKHTVIWSSNGSIPIQPLLAPVLPGPCKPRDPRLVQPGSVTSTRAARTVRGAPSAGRGSGWRVAALSPERRAAGGPVPLGRGAPRSRRPGPARPYLSWRGSQSTPGSSSRAAWRTSSLSMEKLRRWPACATATRIHSISGGSTRKGLRGRTGER